MQIKNSKKLGEIARGEGVLTVVQLKECLAAQRAIADLGCKKKLGEVMVDKGFLDQEKLDHLLRIQREKHQLRTIGDYGLGAKLGQGGMGDVYRATRLSDQAPVALKFLSKEVEERPGYIERFDREAELSATLIHPHLVRSYGPEMVDGRRVLVMEYVEGTTLDRHIAKVGKLSEQEALRVAWQLALALAYVGGKGIVHRDIKPNNVILDQQGTAKLLDLGLARHADSPERDQITVAGEVLGTPSFMAPEQILGRTTDTRTDVYALGATLYMMVTGKPPYADRGDSQAVLMGHLSGQLRSPRELVPGLSAGLVQLIEVSMAAAPECRYQTMEGLATDIERLQRGQAPAFKPPPPPPPEEKAPTGSGGRSAISKSGGSTATAKLARPTSAGRKPAGRRDGATAGRARNRPERTPNKRGVSTTVLAVCAGGLLVAAVLVFSGGKEEEPPPPSVKLLVDVPRGPMLPGSKPPSVPESSPYLELIAKAEEQLAAGNKVGALEILDAAQQLEPERSPAYLLRGRVHLAANRPEAAQTSLLRATQLEPRSLAGWKLLGDACQRLGHNRAALSAFKRALTIGLPPEERSLIESTVASLRAKIDASPNAPDDPSMPIVPPVPDGDPPTDPESSPSVPEALLARIGALAEDWEFEKASAELGRWKAADPARDEAASAAEEDLSEREQAARKVFANLLVRQADVHESKRAYGPAINALRGALAHTDDTRQVTMLNRRIDRWRRDVDDQLRKALEGLRSSTESAAKSKLAALAADRSYAGYASALSAMIAEHDAAPAPDRVRVDRWIAGLPATPPFAEEVVLTGSDCARCEGRGFGPCLGCTNGKVECPCDTCKASGLAPCARCKGTATQACKKCSGSGKRTVTRVVPEDCLRCKGTGKLGDDEECVTCRGAGKINWERKEKVGCETCNQTGKVACDQCGSRGKCAECRGTGKGLAPHGDCEGLGRSYCTTCNGRRKSVARPALPLKSPCRRLSAVPEAPVKDPK